MEIIGYLFRDTQVFIKRSKLDKNGHQIFGTVIYSTSVFQLKMTAGIFIQNMQLKGSKYNYYQHYQGQLRYRENVLY